ncbi:hypothetical protein CgIS1_06500 [Frankia sp. CgS1]|nr:hypothetical protein Manayef4_07520 [Frankia sp. CgIM4]OHV47635.1 hypothetical protein CgIS1_06500 [Frankia sp. CgIS1]
MADLEDGGDGHGLAGAGDDDRSPQRLAGPLGDAATVWTPATANAPAPRRNGSARRAVRSSQPGR